MQYNEDSGLGGHFTERDADVLAKTLMSGEATSIPGSLTAGDGYGLKLEDLQRTLVNVSFTEEEFQFFRRVSKEGAKQTVTQYTRVTSHGDDWGSGVIAEDEEPEDGDSTWERVAEIVRYFGVKGGVTVAMQLAETLEGEAMSIQSSERTLDLLRKIERAMYYGDNSLDSKQMNGLKRSMLLNTSSDLIIDLRGRYIAKEDITGAMAKVGSEPFYGRPTEAHMNLEVLEGLNRQLYPKERIILPAPNALGEVGIAPERIKTSRGPVNLVSSTFINDNLPKAPTVGVGTSGKRPVNPSVNSVPARAAASGSKFVDDDAGDYLWYCAAANRYGRSAAVLLNSGGAALSVLKGDGVTMIVQGGVGPDPMWYEFYRTKKGGAAGTAQLISRIPAAAGGAATTFVDKNENLPGTSSCFLIQNKPDALALRQLGPMMRLLMAVRKPVFEFMLLLFCVLIVKAPNKHVLFLNCGHPNLATA